MGNAERRKGATAELEVVHILRENGWPEATRTSDGRGQGKRGDIVNGPEGCHVEIKRHEKLNVPKALRQVEKDADPTDLPLLIHRPKCRHAHKPVDEWMVTAPLTAVLELLKLRES